MKKFEGVFMKKWHVNDKGNAGRCNATTEQGCPFGNADEHYNTKAEALYAYETKNNDQVFSNTLIKKSSKQKFYKFVAISGVALSSVSLVGCDSNISITDDGNIEIEVEGESYEFETDGSESEEPSDDEGNYGSSPTDPNSVLWQGKSIQPSDEEIEEAKTNLDQLVIVDELNRTDYNRDEMFGSFKSGVVEGIQLRDLPNATFGDNAKANGGYMMDPYTGERVELSSENKSDIDTEHIVALKEITESERIVINTDSEAEAIKEDPQLIYDYVDMGESNLTDEEIQDIIDNPENLEHYYLDSDAKKEIANSEDNLTMVSSSANRSKGDKDPADWMPSYDTVHCTYIVSSIKVKHDYGLSIDNSENEVMQDVLENKCN